MDWPPEDSDKAKSLDIVNVSGPLQVGVIKKEKDAEETHFEELTNVKLEYNLRSLQALSNGIVHSTTWMNLGLCFLGLPSHVFDTYQFPVKNLIVARVDNANRGGQENCLAKIAPILCLEVYFVNIQERLFFTAPQRLRYDSSISFGVKLYDDLPESKLFVLWIKVFVDNTLAFEACSHEMTLLHDSLKDNPPVLTPDVYCFPQKVTMLHHNNCKSKATLSKRHKRDLLRKGGQWCRNPARCEALQSCVCQAYPSRTIRKLLKQIQQALAQDSTAPSALVAKTNSLWEKLNERADVQAQRFGDYFLFLAERVERWKLLLAIQQYTAAPECPPQIRSHFAALWDTLWN
jgi:hypothetical protein